MAEDLLYPGDFIANAEEFTPGDGTYLDDGEVRAACIGTAKKDMDNRVVNMKPVSRMPMLQRRGLVVVGKIMKASDKVAFLDLLPVEKDGHTYLPSRASHVLRVNNITRGFVKSLKDCFKVGDIVRAKIIETSPDDVQLSTDAPDLGVIKAFCTRCRSALDKDGDGVKCPECGWKDRRHMAKDYRAGNL